MTSIVDTFDRADASSLGTTSDGNATWTNVAGTWGIASNQAKPLTFGGPDVVAVATIPGSSADGTVTLVVNTTGTGGEGVVFRLSDASNYLMVQYDPSNGGRLYKIAGAAYTLLASFTAAAGDTVEVDLAGSSIIVKVNGSTVATVTNTFNQTATQFGLYGVNTANRLDSFSYVPAVTAISISGTSARTRGSSTTERVGPHVSGAGARARTATATIALTDDLAGESDRTRDATATIEVAVPFVIESGPGWEANGRTRDASATIHVDDAIVTPPASHNTIKTAWLVISAPPTVDSDGKVDAAAWRAAATEHHDEWGRYRIVVGGKDVTFFRGIETLVLSESDTEPFGDDLASVVFPGISPYEVLGAGALAWLPGPDDARHIPVTIERISPTGHLTVRWEGDCDVLTDSFQGSSYAGLQVQFLGVIKTLDERITKPRFTSDPVDIGRFITTLVAYEARFGWNGHPPAIVDTGTQTAERGAYGDALATVTIQNLLATDGDHTLANLRPRGMRLIVKDRTTVHFTLWCGQPGVTHSLTRDLKHAVTAIFGEGQDHGTKFWRNTQYPNAPISPPAYPLADGVFFDPGDGHSGFRPFADELRTRGYPMRSGDTYLSGDEATVRDFQDDAGITVDGVVGGQTWNAAFQTGANAHALYAWIRPLVVTRAAEPFLYSARGGEIGRSPHYTGLTRREKLEQFGTLDRTSARQSAAKELLVVQSSDYVGTVTATNIDPPEMCALDTHSGMNFLFKHHRGVDRLLHVAKTDRNPGMQAGQPRAVTWTASERGDDYVTLAARMLQKQDVVDQSGRAKAPRRTSKVSPDFAPWDSESGAGFLPPMAQTAGLWNVYAVPAGERGSIVHVRLVANTPCLIAAAIFNAGVTSNELANLPGLADPSSGSAGGQDPWQVNAAALTKTLVYADQPWLAWATGGPGAMQGYWPNEPAEDATVTGVLDDAASTPFHSAHAPWLWLAVWTSANCRIGGDPAFGYRALFPGPDA